MARLTDVRVLEEARAVAREIWAEDPELTLPKNRLLSSRVDEFWQGGEGDLS
jgi:hypothetical protein